MSGPELSRILSQFEGEYHLDGEEEENYWKTINHNVGPASQRHFQREVQNLKQSIQHLGNPFLDDFEDLVTLDSRNCADDIVVSSLRTLENTGKEQYDYYCTEVLERQSKSLHVPIKKNSFRLFKNSKP